MSKHLTLEERERISQMHYAGMSDSEIGQALDRHRGTIGRELARNSVDDEYSAVVAERQAQERRRRGPLVRKLDRPEVAAYVRRGLAQRWSPNQIAGRAKRDFPRDRTRHVSHQTIYTWIASRSEVERRHFTGFLRRGGGRPAREDGRGRLAKQVSIAGRPKVVDARRRYGDWEGDMIVGARNSGAVLTLVERKSGYLLTAKSCDRQASRVAQKIISRLDRLPARLRRTVTFDNGKEFAEHEWFSRRLDLDVYFAESYCSWQRGTSENTNGLMRQYLPKGTDLRRVSWQKLEIHTHQINDRPRKRLNYRAPAEVFEPLVAIES